MARSLADFLDSMMIAMEADDITQQTQNEVRSAIGGRNLTTDDDGPVDDMTNTTDIFNQNNDDPAGNPEQDNQEGQELNETGPENPDETEEQNPDENQGEEGGDDAPASDDPNLQENPEEQQPIGQTDNNNDPSFAKKNVVRDNMAKLYTIVSGDIENLVSSLSNINDLASIKVVNAAIGHLRNCKEYLYKTLTVGLGDMDYEELLQRYITLKRVYDVATKMLEVHFREDAKNREKPKRK